VTLTSRALALAGVAAIFAAPAQAYERCKSFGNAELKAMTTERLEKAYCSNEDRLIEILEVVRSSHSGEAERDRDGCHETLIKLSAQPNFDRQGNCPSAVQAGASPGREETQQKERDLLRNLGIAGEKGID
jgi:hypothetical protein